MTMPVKTLIESDFICFIMRKLRYIYGLAFLAMAACSENAPDESVMNGNIQLGAVVGELQINSRAVAAPFLSQDRDTLEAKVWFRNSNGDYKTDNPDAMTNLPAHTTMKFVGSQMAYAMYKNKNIKYPADNSEVYCIGLYPVSGWDTTEISTVSHAIDGAADLMFAPEISGNWTGKFPRQEYEHLLTWIKITVCASSHEAIDAWGTIKQISVNSDSEVKVTLQTGDCDYGGTSQQIATMSEGVTLTTANHEVGSVFCSPEKTYTVTVISENKSGETITKTVNLDLNIIDIDKDDEVKPVNDENEARGRCFVFSLYFTPYDVIEGECTLNSWSNQYEDIYFK